MSQVNRCLAKKELFGKIVDMTRVVPSESVLVFYGAGVPVYVEPLHERVVEGDDVGGDVAVVGLVVRDLQPLVVEAVSAPCSTGARTKLPHSVQEPS